jgi:hypothetical protein
MEPIMRSRQRRRPGIIGRAAIDIGLGCICMV